MLSTMLSAGAEGGERGGPSSEGTPHLEEGAGKEKITVLSGKLCFHGRGKKPVLCGGGQTGAGPRSPHFLVAPKLEGRKAS